MGEVPTHNWMLSSHFLPEPSPNVAHQEGKILV